MIGHTTQHEEMIDGEVCAVLISHRSRSAWLAAGLFRGERIRGSGGSETAAISAWRQKANYKAKG